MGRSRLRLTLSNVYPPRWLASTPRCLQILCIRDSLGYHFFFCVFCLGLVAEPYGAVVFDDQCIVALGTVFPFLFLLAIFSVPLQYGVRLRTRVIVLREVLLQRGIWHAPRQTRRVAVKAESAKALPRPCRQKCLESKRVRSGSARRWSRAAPPRQMAIRIQTNQTRSFLRDRQSPRRWFRARVAHQRLATHQQPRRVVMPSRLRQRLERLYHRNVIRE